MLTAQRKAASKNQTQQPCMFRTIFWAAFTVLWRAFFVLLCHTLMLVLKMLSTTHLKKVPKRLLPILHIGESRKVGEPSSTDSNSSRSRRNPRKGGPQGTCSWRPLLLLQLKYKGGCWGICPSWSPPLSPWSPSHTVDATLQHTSGLRLVGCEVSQYCCVSCKRHYMTAWGFFRAVIDQ